jgi:hypothetical protein
MALYRTCRCCGDVDVTVSKREGVPSNLAVSCVSCYVSARTSSTKAQAVPERDQHDRYAQMAAKYGVK